jgi:hypothetical protein
MSYDGRSEEVHMHCRRTGAIALVALIGLSAPSLVACDKEDKKDLQEGVNDVEQGAKKVGNEIEKGIDNTIDTDGKDD